MIYPNEAYWTCAQAGVNPNARGDPGMGKTQSVYAFAKAVGRKVYTLIGSIRDPAEIAGYPHPFNLTWNGQEGQTMRIPTATDYPS